jgi:hypothetical protein
MQSAWSARRAAAVRAKVASVRAMDQEWRVVSQPQAGSIFNPRASVEIVRFDREHFCLVIDEALADAHAVREPALANARQFSSVDFSYYPGIYLMASDGLRHDLAAYFQFHARRHFDARRGLETICRYSLVTRPPHDLHPLQWLCHRDDVGLDPRLSMQASVLYLFHDTSLGGTGFYTPRRSPAEIGALFADARLLDRGAFAAKYGLASGYQCASNAYFERIGGIEPKWNRLIIYDGGMLHASDITTPERLSADPSVGRLTLNGFFTSRRHLHNTPRR